MIFSYNKCFIYRNLYKYFRSLESYHFYFSYAKEFFKKKVKNSYIKHFECDIKCPHCGKWLWENFLEEKLPIKLIDKDPTDLFQLFRCGNCCNLTVWYSIGLGCMASLKNELAKELFPSYFKSS